MRGLDWSRAWVRGMWISRVARRATAARRAFPFTLGKSDGSNESLDLDRFPEYDQRRFLRWMVTVGIMVNRNGRGCRYCGGRGEIRRSPQDRQQRRRSPSTFPLVKDETEGNKED